MEVGTVLSVVQTLISVLQSEELKQALSIFGYRSQLDDLKQTVDTINAVLRDAEFKQLSTLDQIFIDKLKDAAFEADDLIDEFLTLAEQKKLLKADGNISQKLSNFLSRSKNPFTMSRRIKHIKNKLDDIAYNRQFSITIDHEPIKKRSRETCSYVDEAQIIGREDDLEKIVGTLLASSHDPKSNDVSVLSIVGIGGLGKTALAQLVYNDPRVTNAFPLKMWTCVSDEGQKELNVKNILFKILDSILHEKPNKDLTMDEVQSQLQKELAGIKYLLVLDDVWTENRHQWCKLVEYLIGGERGSYIVITTRSQKTATITGSLMYGLLGLSKENSWSLFIRTTFDSIQSNLPDEELVRIGEKIVNRCAGVPLAIRVAGSLLYGQDKNKWMNIQEIGLANIRDADNDIVPILELSFHHLETPLKNCFRYCALFPKDYEIEKEALISLWMAQGYICELDEGQSIENAAEEYFAILLKRCFFQDIKKNEYGEICSCKIHDLMHDIAQKVSKSEIDALNTISGKVDKNIRHLSILNMSQLEKYYSLGNSHIRSLFSFINCELAMNQIKSFKRLRVLDLSKKNIKCLPDSIGELLHLRYIDLSGNRMMEVLPNSITKLCNLQTLLLYHCNKLEELPKDFTRLVKLSVLDIDKCFQMRCMPKGMSKLTSLHMLKGEYRVGGEGRCKSWKQWLDGLEDLKSLVNLKGLLKIRIQQWLDDDAKNDVKEDHLREGLYLRRLEHLDNLELYFPFIEKIEEEGIRMRVMEALQPHSNLKRLTVVFYNGMEMPGWITLLPHLVKLKLSFCPELKYLPWLGKLCHLKSLTLHYLSGLEYMITEEESRELATTSSTAQKLPFYPSLEEIDLYDLPKLKGWRRGVELEETSNHNSTIVIPQVIMQLCLPQLKILKIVYCEEFTCSLLCPMLETLKLRRFNEGMRIECTKKNDEKSSDEAAIHISNLRKLRELKVDNGAWLDSIPMESFHCLQSLVINLDNRMEELPRCLQYFSALQTLKISRCQNLKAMPNWMPKLTSLNKLKIVKCLESLQSRCKKDPPGEDWPLIQHISKISFTYRD